MIDKFWIRMWQSFAIAILIACFLMGILAALNGNCQRSDECVGEEAEAIDGMTTALWDEFKIIIPIGAFILLGSYWIYLVDKNSIFSTKD